MTKQELPIYLQLLQSHFESTKVRNPSYSYRSFARHLGINHVVFHRFLNQKRVPPRQVAEEICKKLSLTPEASSAFILSVLSSRARRALEDWVHEFSGLSSIPKMDLSFTADAPEGAFRIELSVSRITQRTSGSE